MHRKQKNRSGDRITGCLDSFLVEELEKVFKDIFSTGNVVVENLLGIFRENSKIAVALRMRPAVDMNRSISVISENSRNIITNYLNTHNHGADTGYIDCSLRYFSGEKQHNISLDLNCASCRSKDPDKALAHARTKIEMLLSSSSCFQIEMILSIDATRGSISAWKFSSAIASITILSQQSRVLSILSKASNFR